jgi:hypothetical protein
MHVGVHTGIRLVGRTSLRIILSDVGERRLGPMRRLDQGSEAIFRKIEKNDDSEGFTYIIPLVPLERAWGPENGLGALKWPQKWPPRKASEMAPESTVGGHFSGKSSKTPRCFDSEKTRFSRKKSH